MLAFQDRLNFVHGVISIEPLTPIIGQECLVKNSYSQMVYNYDNLHPHHFS